MENEKKAFLEDDLLEADRVVLQLYEKTQEPIEWDESDDEVLAFSRSIRHTESRDAAAAEAPVADSAAPAPEAADEQGNVVAFKPRRPVSVRRIFQSPAAGFAIAASLMIGVFAGQGMTPYFNLGLAPDYETLVQENSELKEEVALTRSIQVRPSAQGTTETEIASGADLRGIATLLSGYTCANLSLRVTDGLNLSVSGHVGSSEDLQRLSSDLAPLGAVGPVTSDVQVYAWPFCQAVEVLATQSRDDAQGLQSPSAQPYNHGPVYLEGEDLILEARASTLAGGYLYVDYLQHDGTVLHLLPTEKLPENELQAGESILIGNGQQRYTLVPPFGNDMVMVVQSPVPLFDGARPEVETAEEYLLALHEALARTGGQDPQSTVLSAYSFIRTQAEGDPAVSQQ